MKVNYWRTLLTWHILEALLLFQILIAQLQQSITSYRLSLQESRLYVHLEDLVQSAFTSLCNKQNFCLIFVSRSGTKNDCSGWGWFHCATSSSNDGDIAVQLKPLVITYCIWHRWKILALFQKFVIFLLHKPPLVQHSPRWDDWVKNIACCCD